MCLFAFGMILEERPCRPLQVVEKLGRCGVQDVGVLVRENLELFDLKRPNGLDGLGLCCKRCRHKEGCSTKRRCSLEPLNGIFAHGNLHHQRELVAHPIFVEVRGALCSDL